MNGKRLWIIVSVVALATLTGVSLLLVRSLEESKGTSAVVEARSDGAFPKEPITDDQGAVSVEVTPLNLNGPGDTLEFSIGMNTHSVELDVDLAANATLSTNTGLTIPPVEWDAPSGGHHVAGTLSFASSLDGAPVLDGVTELTLTLRNIDAAERVFVWALKPGG